jgi:hypothetical protein
VTNFETIFRPPGTIRGRKPVLKNQEENKRDFSPDAPGSILLYSENTGNSFFAKATFERLRVLLIFPLVLIVSAMIQDRTLGFQVREFHCSRRVDSVAERNKFR